MFTYYIEFFDTSDDAVLLGEAGIGFSVEKIGEIKKLKSVLDKLYVTEVFTGERNYDKKVSLD